MRIDYVLLSIIGAFALVIGSFVWRRLKFGSWTGAFMKGSIEQTYGEIELSRSDASSEVLKVVALRDSGGEAFVGLLITTKTPTSLTPYRLSKDEARKLADLLKRAGK